MIPRTLTIKVAIPVDVDVDDVAEFATVALRRWGGAFHPDDPLFHGLLILSMRTDDCKYLHNSDSELTGKVMNK